MRISLLFPKTLLALFVTLASFSLGNAQTFNVDTLVKNGDLNHCINFVFMGDGYTASQQSNYITAVQNIKDSIFSKVPFSNYKNYFNVFAIKVVSQESGVKHPHTASDCPPLSSFPIADPNDYFGTSFDNSGIHRLVYPTNTNLANTVAVTNFPLYDQLLIVSNTTQYGGAGGAFAVGTENSMSVEIMEHELGHSFAGLADEYWAGDVYAAEKPNMTNQVNATPSLVKWKNWLGVSGTGIYQYCCGGTSASWYKPHQNCLMQFLNRQYCPVCRQRIIERIYELVNPIVAYLPTDTSVAITDSLPFKLTKLLLPIPNTLKIQWELNGQLITTNVSQIMLHHAELQPGSNVLEAVVTDTTSMLREAPTYTHNINKVIWHINDSPNGIAIDGNASKMSFKIYPNPASDLLHIEAAGIPVSGKEVTIKIYDLLGRRQTYLHAKPFAGGFSKEINLRQLPSGNYFLQLSTDKMKEQFKISIVH